MLLLFLMMGNALTTVKQLRITMWICVLSATVVSSTAVMDYLVHGSVTGGRLTALVNGPYAGANYFSVTIVLMMPFVMLDVFLHPRIIVRIIAFHLLHDSGARESHDAIPRGNRWNDGRGLRQSFGLFASGERISLRCSRLS